MEKKQNIRIVDIAKMAKVSVGTVDRVLHNRGRVSDEKRKQVEKVLKEIDYEPNMVARFLASRKTFSFAVMIPSYEKGEYWELVSEGIEKAAHELKDFNVSIDYLYFNQFDSESFSKTAQQLNKTDYAGVIIATLHKDKVIKLSKELDVKELPYVFIDSNIPNCNNLSYFGADSSMSGAIAAKLILSEVGKEGNVVIVHGDYKQDVFSTQTESREKGFLDYLNRKQHKGKISHLTFYPLDKKKTASELDKLLDDGIKSGIIIFNSRIYEVVDTLESMSKDISKLSLIGYDSIERNAQALLDNKVSYLISQRSIQQGYDSIKSLSNHLIFNSLSTKENYMPIDILIKENISFYRD